MVVDARTREIMIGALEGNLAYTQGERVALIGQRWEPHLPIAEKPTMDRAMELWETLSEVYRDAGVRIFPFDYTPTKTGSTVEPPESMMDGMEKIARARGDFDVVLAPTAYSLTHTDFMTGWATKGARIATMSNSSLAMLSPGGPFDSREPPAEMAARTHEFAAKLRGSEYVRVIGPNASLVMHIDPHLVHASTGITDMAGEKGNWLGAEAYAVPVDPRDGGSSHGWFIVPTGWGGREQLEYAAMFSFENGRFKTIRAMDIGDKTPEAQRWLDENVSPRILPNYGAPEGHDVVAELGLGTNTAIRSDYIRKNWSIAVAEKMQQTDQGQTVHIAEGNSAGMGGRNNVKHHEDWLVLDVQRIDFDYKPPKLFSKK